VGRVHQHDVSRHDVEDSERQHALGFIERHSVADASAAIMSNDVKAIETKAAHERHLIGGHDAE
jgi:hypothetical protein